MVGWGCCVLQNPKTFVQCEAETSSNEDSAAPLVVVLCVLCAQGNIRESESAVDDATKAKMSQFVNSTIMMEEVRGDHMLCLAPFFRTGGTSMILRRVHVLQCLVAALRELTSHVGPILTLSHLYMCCSTLMVMRWTVTWSCGMGSAPTGPSQVRSILVYTTCHALPCIVRGLATVVTRGVEASQ